MSFDWNSTTLNPKLSEQLGRIDGKLTTLHRFFYVNVVIGSDTTITHTAPVSSIQPQDPAVIVGDVVVGNDGYLASVTAISTTTLTLTPLNEFIGGSNHALCYYNDNVVQNSGSESRGVIPLHDVLPTPRVGDYIIGKNGYIAEVSDVVLENNTVEYIGTAKNLTGYTDVTAAADTAISGGTATDVLDYLRQLNINGNYIYDNTANIYYCRVTVQGSSSQIIWVEVVHCSDDLQLHRYTYRNGSICKKTDEGPLLTRMSYLADPTGGNDAVNLGYLESYVATAMPLLVTFTGTTGDGNAHSSVDFSTIINAVNSNRVIAPRYLDDINNVYYNLVTARYVAEGSGLPVYVAQGVFYNESGTGALEKVITCKLDSSGCYIYIH